MMTTTKITKIIIHHVANIEINDVQEEIKDEFSDRTLFIETMDGDRYEIALWAYSPDKLEIKEKGETIGYPPKSIRGSL
jgi:hypothetical protein